MPPTARKLASAPCTMAVRRERPADHAAVRALHVAAFTVDPVSGAVRTADDVVGAPPEIGGESV